MHIRKTLVVAFVMAACLSCITGCRTDKNNNLPEGSVREEDLFPDSGEEAVEVPETDPVEGKIDYISSQYDYEDEPNYFKGHDPEEADVRIPVNNGGTKNDDGNGSDSGDKEDGGSGDLNISAE